MKKRGRRPSLVVTDEILDEIEEMAGKGLTQKQIASFYGISHMTWHKMKNADERIQESCKVGKSKTIDFVAGKLMQQIKIGNLPAIIFYLKTQAGWSEKTFFNVETKVKSKKVDYTITTKDPIEASKVR